MEFFEGRLSIETLESLDTDRLNNMISEKEKMLIKREEQAKAYEENSRRKNGR